MFYLAYKVIPSTASGPGEIKPYITEKNPAVVENVNVKE